MGVTILKLTSEEVMILRKRKLTKLKIFTAILVLSIDLLLLPSLIRLPAYFKDYGMDGMDMWVDEFSPVVSFKNILQEAVLLRGFLVLQLLVALLIILILLKGSHRSSRVSPGIGGPEAAGNGEHGTARFQTVNETIKSTILWKFREVVITGGIVFGSIIETNRRYSLIDSSDVNSIIVGTTRSGKTRRIVYPTMWMLSHTNESMLMTDPKGELYERAAPYLRKQGYKVKVVDFREPGWGNRWNPMQPVLDALDHGDIALANQHAWSTANMFVYQKPGSDKGGGESIWKDGAESVIAALILVVALEAPQDNQKHMYSVYKTLAELGKSRKIMIGNTIQEYVALNDYMDSLPQDHPARDAYATAALSPEKTRGSFFSNVASILRLFSDPSIRFLTAEQDHVLHDIGREKTAVFLIIPDEDKTRHPMAALYVDQTYKALVKLANGNKGRLPVRVNMILDEFGNMPPLKDFDTKLTVSLGRGIRWNLILQDFKQLDIAYGSDVATVIRGNCQNLIYLLTTDEKTAKLISERLGTYTISSEGSSYNVSKSSVNRGGSFGLMKRDLLTAEEILKWPMDKSLIIRARLDAAVISLPDLSEYPADQDFTADDIEVERNLSKVHLFIPEINKLTQKQEEEEEDIEFEPETSFMSDGED
jgi:type IV secretion system protein VirD4